MNQIHSTTKEYDAIIVGAGFSGLYQLICLRDQLGLNCLVLETGKAISKPPPIETPFTAAIKGLVRLNLEVNPAKPELAIFKSIFPPA